MLTSNFNLWDLTNLVRSPQFQEANKSRYHGHALTSPKSDFHGFSSVDEIDTILNAPISNNSELKPHSKTFDMVCSVSGSIVNIDAYLNGEPEDMYTFVSSESNTVEDLNLYISLSWKVPATDIAAAAQRIKAYVESRPSNVSLNINIRTDYRTVEYSGRKQTSKDLYSMLINVASADDYLTDQVINLIGHPMFYRYIILQYICGTLDSNCNVEPCPPDYINFLTFNKQW